MKIIKPRKIINEHRDILNQRYGSFTAIRRKHLEHGFRHWLLKCECGAKVKVSWQDLNKGLIPTCPNKDCWPSERYERQYDTVAMWSQINARKRQQRYEENRIKREKEKEAKRKRLEKEQGGYGPEDFDDWGDF